MIETVKIYYETKLAIVRDSIDSDVSKLANDMRPADIREIWKSHHATPESALLSGYTESVICLTIERNKRPIAMFGVIPYTILGSKAFVWLLASPELEKIQRAFVKHSRRFIKLMLGYCPILENYVDIKNKQSIKWLRWIRAEFGPTIPYGIEQQPFTYFSFRRKNA